MICQCGCGQQKSEIGSKNRVLTPYVRGHNPESRNGFNKNPYPKKITIYIKECKNCGQTFSVTGTKKKYKFCTKNCREFYGRIQKSCEQCGKNMITTKSKPLTCCSKECFLTWCKGRCMNTGRTHFEKGIIPWNKERELVEIPKHRRVAQYRRKIFGDEILQCNRCEKTAKLVHHINRNPKDDKIENLEPLCYSCHSKEHKTEMNLPSYRRYIQGEN